MTDLLDFTIKIEPQSESRMLATLCGIKRPDIFASQVIKAPRGLIAPAVVEALFIKLWPEWLRQNALHRRQPLNGKMQKFYKALVAFWSEEGRAPTHDEMAIAMGFSHRATSHWYVKELIARGWVWKNEFRHPVPVDVIPTEFAPSAE